MDLVEKIENLLRVKKNNIGLDYLLEIISVKYELSKCEILFLECYLKYKKTNEQELADYTAYFIKDYLYRLYDLLEKISQLINTALFSNRWKELRECNWDLIKKEMLNSTEYVLYRNSINQIDNYKDLFSERMSLTHRRIVKGAGSSFTSHILPLGGESSIDYEEWNKKSWSRLRNARKEIELFFEQILEEILKKS